jgi:hypothetical protein
MAANEREDRILKELSGIREEIAGLRKAVEGESAEDEVTRKLAELDVEIRLAQIEEEVQEERKPKKRRWFGRKRNTWRRPSRWELRSPEPTMATGSECSLSSS